MKRLSTLLVSASVLGAMGVGGCGGEPPGSASEAINTSPASLEEAATTLAKIGDILKKDPNDSRALTALRSIQPSLDELNRVVARTEVQGHEVTFYESLPGVVTVSERHPMNTDRLLTEEDRRGDPVALYRRLAGVAEAPAALVDAQERATRLPKAEAAATVGGDHLAGGPSSDPPPQGEQVGRTQELLTANDGAYFARYCYTGGDADWCEPNWWGGAWVSYNTKISVFSVAPYSGSYVSVQISYNGLLRRVLPVFAGDWEDFEWDSARYCPPWPLACGTPDYEIANHLWEVVDHGVAGYHWTAAFVWN
jgi:hypothetical protein